MEEIYKTTPKTINKPQTLGKRRGRASSPRPLEDTVSDDTLSSGFRSLGLCSI